jgi:hypothetical protein
VAIAISLLQARFGSSKLICCPGIVVWVADDPGGIAWLARIKVPSWATTTGR